MTLPKKDSGGPPSRVRLAWREAHRRCWVGQGIGLLLFLYDKGFLGPAPPKRGARPTIFSTAARHDADCPGAIGPRRGKPSSRPAACDSFGIRCHLGLRRASRHFAWPLADLRTESHRNSGHCPRECALPLEGLSPRVRSVEKNSGPTRGGHPCRIQTGKGFLDAAHAHIPRTTFSARLYRNS